MQKRVVAFLIISLVMVFMSVKFISSVEPSCDIVARDECGGGKHVVMGISDLTNAHGEFPDSGISGYDFVLCCDFQEVRGATCIDEDLNGISDNKIIGLSSSTNAHAESPAQNTYLVDVCYDDLKCITTSTSCSETNPLYPLSILSLSNYTNAHIGESGDYPNFQICCKGLATAALTCELTNASWEYPEVYEDTNVGLIVKGTDCNRAGIKFEVWKDNLLLDKKMTSPANAEFSGDMATGNWSAEEPGEFYFKAELTEDDSKKVDSKDLGNPLLIVNERDPDYCDAITLCSNYNIISDCNTDYCAVAESNAPETLDCSDSAINCSCSWDSGAGECEFLASYEGGEIDGEEFGPGTCESKQETTDDCSNGYLTYNYIANWTGLPADKPSSCVDSTQTIKCSAQAAQLPFINIYSILISIALIVLIYIILTRKKKSGSKRKVKKK